MTDAKKLSLQRFAFASAGIIAPIVAGFVLRFATLPAGFSATVMIVSFAAGGVVFFYFTFRWRPLCPTCKNARATFIRAEQDKELLVCGVCGYREPTGWVYGDS